MALISTVMTQDVMDLTERDPHEFQALLDDFERLGGRTSSPKFVLLDAAEKLVGAEMHYSEAVEVWDLLRETTKMRCDLGGGVVL